MSKKWVVVVPTIREQQLKEFIESFKDLFDKHVDTLLVIEDNPTKTFSVPESKTFLINHFAWEDIDATLEENSWIIPRRTDCIRSFGFLLATQISCPYVLTLDDDVRYNGVDIFEMYERGFEAKTNNAPFFDTMHLGSTVSARGYPFKYRNHNPIMLQWGMWEGVPDLDGATQLNHPITDYKIPEVFVGKLQVIQKGVGVTGCIMNCAFRREVIPAMYQLLMGQDAQGNAWPYDRWGDIWSGHLAKKYVEDVLGGCVAINYAAHIKHERASNVYANIQKELSGYKINETIWEKLSKYFTPSYEYMSYIVEDNDVMLFGKESKKYAEAMRVWSRLTQ